MTKHNRAHHRIIVLGAGPAGVSAALGFAEARIEALLLERSDQCGGQLFDIPSPIWNVMPAYENGAAAQAGLAKIMKTNQLSLTAAAINQVLEPEGGDKTIVLLDQAGHEWSCDYLIVATGLRPRTLEFEPSHLNERVFGHTPEFSGSETVAVVGGGDSALLKALKLADKVKHVHVIHRSNHFKARPDVLDDIRSRGNITVHHDATIAALSGKDKISGITIRSNCDNSLLEVAAQAVIVKAGYIPNTEILPRRLLTSGGYVDVDCNLETACPNLFACGDITAGNYPRIATALGQGMAAAAQIIERIFRQERPSGS
jgi:thioredoxin reductase (NADPH)